MTMNHHDLAMSDSIPHAYNIPHAYKALFAPMVPTSRVQLSQRFPQESSLIKTAILKQMYTLHAEDSSDRLESIINSLMDESEVPRDALDRFNDFLLKRAKKKIDKEKQSVDRGKGLLRRWVEQDQGIRDDESWEDLLTIVNLTLKSDEFGQILFGEITPEHRQKAPWLPTKPSQILAAALARPRQWKDVSEGEEPGKRWVAQYILGPLNEVLDPVWTKLQLGPSHPRPPLVPILTRRQRYELDCQNRQANQ
ncbi:hypothetical protein FB446DRAFT_759049 [Lentinula raphanica]|nr:hypothetical protein FB446DRAFT_759049 [Lentinula raphanica]